MGYTFLPCDATAERGYATVCRLTVCRSVCDVQVPWSRRLEYARNYFTTE